MDYRKKINSKNKKIISGGSKLNKSMLFNVSLSLGIASSLVDNMFSNIAKSIAINNNNYNYKNIFQSFSPGVRLSQQLKNSSFNFW